MKPSQEKDNYWIVAICNDNNSELRELRKKAELENGGKWLVFADISEIDSLWEKINVATKNGLLGGGSKASTARPNSNAKDPNQKVICVYTLSLIHI